MTFVAAKAFPCANTQASYQCDFSDLAYAAGDTLILFVVTNTTSGNAATISGSWTDQSDMAKLTGDARIYSKTAVASEPIVTVSNSHNSRGASAILVLRGETPDWAGVVQAYNAASTDTPGVAAKTLAAGVKGYAFGWMRSSSWASGDGWTAVTNWTERADSIGYGSGGSAALITEWTGSGNIPATSWVTAPNAATSANGGSFVLTTTATGHSGTISQSDGGTVSETGRKGGTTAAAAISAGLGSASVSGKRTAKATPVESAGAQLTFTGSQSKQRTFNQVGGMSGSPGIQGSKLQPNQAALGFSTGVQAVMRKDATAAGVTDSEGARLTFTGFVTLPLGRSGTFISSDGGAFTVAVARSGHAGPSVLSAGAQVAFTGQRQQTRVISLTGGGTATFAGRKTGRGVLSLLAGSVAVPAPWTGSSSLPAVETHAGNFVLSAGGDFRSTSPSEWVLFVLGKSQDDHQRTFSAPYPAKGLWKRVAPPHSAIGLLLFRDGRVMEVTSLGGSDEWDADFVIATGQWYGKRTDWQAQVLTDAGYTLTTIDKTSGLAGVA